MFFVSFRFYHKQPFFFTINLFPWGVISVLLDQIVFPSCELTKLKNDCKKQTDISNKCKKRWNLCVDTTFSSFIVSNLLNKYFIDIFLKLIWLVFFIFRSFLVILKGFSNRVLCIDKKTFLPINSNFVLFLEKFQKRKLWPETC